MITKKEILELIRDEQYKQFSPKDISTCVGWYDFTDKYTITQSAFLISQINDKSTAANNLVQATGGSQPTYVSYGGLNDRGYATFVSGKSLKKTGLSYSQPYTIFIVYRENTFGSGGLMMNFDGGGTNGIAQYSSAFGGVTYKSLGPVANGGYFNKDFHYLNQWNAAGWVVNAANSKKYFQGIVGEYADELSNLIYYTHSAGASGITQMQIGQAVACDIHEVILFNAALSDSDLNRVGNYLHTKYDIPRKGMLVCFGDSITAGFNSTSTSAGYPYRVGQYKNVNVYNLGVSGTSLVTDFMPNYSKYIRKIPKDAWISIQYGSNDWGGNFASPWGTSLRGAIQNLINAGFQPSRIILTTPPYSSTRAAAYVNLVAILTQCVTDFGVKYADCITPTLAGGGNSLLTDGTHPSDAGHDIMAIAIAAVMV